MGHAAGRGEAHLAHHVGDPRAQLTRHVHEAVEVARVEQAYAARETRLLELLPSRLESGAPIAYLAFLQVRVARQQVVGVARHLLDGGAEHRELALEYNVVALQSGHRLVVLAVLLRNRYVLLLFAEYSAEVALRKAQDRWYSILYCTVYCITHVDLFDQVGAVGEEFVQRKACFEELHARPDQLNQLLPFLVHVLLPFGHLLSINCTYQKSKVQ